MLRKNPKCRCEKRTSTKSKEVCRLYTRIQAAYLSVLEASEDVKTIQCNVPLAGVDAGAYTSDFLCEKTNGCYMVRECVEKKYLTKPQTVHLLDISRNYWAKREINDWGIVSLREENNV